MTRPERSFENFSRGPELVKAIQATWAVNVKIPRSLPDCNEQIAANCEKICRDFDLTYEEWHHWCRLASKPA